MLNKLRFQISTALAQLAQRLRNNFYLYLAALLTAGVLLDAGLLHIGENMRQKAFDMMIRQRVIMPKPDADIVIVDVNEASLAALAPDYGRWPWPRQVMGEFLEHLETQQPKAVVFDILFSDADLYNPDSDTYFNDAIAATSNTFFPFLRLAPEQDKLSQVMPRMVPGAVNTQPANKTQESGVALVLPHFTAALQPGRLGMHNIYPDADGIVREYRLWQFKDQWRLPSLPLSVAQAQGYATPPEPNMLINWRGGPFTYHSISFSDVYRDMTAKTPKRPADEFKGKIVIIGSTAPSLFDLKATAMSKLHPGVEILATAIDNLKHDDYLRVWRGAFSYVALSLLLIWLTAGAFYKDLDRDRFDKLFGFSQIGLLGISYLGLNLGNIYLDLTGPVTWAVACFSIGKIYALANERALQRLLATEPLTDGTARASLLLIHLQTPQPLTEATLKQLRRLLQSAAQQPCSVDELKGIQSGIWGQFGDCIGVIWHIGADKAAADAAQLLSQLPDIMRKAGLPPSVTFRHALQQLPLDADSTQWRLLFAQTVIKLEQNSLEQKHSPAPPLQQEQP